MKIPEMWLIASYKVAQYSAKQKSKHRCWVHHWTRISYDCRNNPGKGCDRESQENPMTQYHAKSKITLQTLKKKILENFESHYIELWSLQIDESNHWKSMLLFDLLKIINYLICTKEIIKWTKKKICSLISKRA